MLEQPERSPGELPRLFAVKLGEQATLLTQEGGPPPDVQ